MSFPSMHLRSGTVAILGTIIMGAAWFDFHQDDPTIILPEPVVDSDYYENGQHDPAKVELGEVLFFDQLLSGNKNISCATCHHPRFATTDTVALPLGQGPTGLGPDRQFSADDYAEIHGRVPRNTPALFNLGAKEFTRMFHDGRVEVDERGYYESGFITPAKWKFPKGLDNVLAAQAMFPISSPDEMAGHAGNNEMAEMKRLNNLAAKGGLWELAARRLQAVPEYVEMFKEAFPDEIMEPTDIKATHAANAIGAYEAQSFRADQSPFDEYLRSGQELSPAAMRGMQLFYGKANCVSCHSGKFQTDHDFYAIAMPQIGPGKSDGYDDSYWRETGIQAFVEDFGRGRETKRDEDMYKFRTPSLRNVELSAPYGHDGAYPTLEGVIRHHLDPVKSLMAYELPEQYLQELPELYWTVMDKENQLVSRKMSEERKNNFLKRDSWVMSNPELRDKIAAANELEPMSLTDDEVNDLIAFMHSLTDPRSRDLSAFIPERVPSGHVVER